jgi:hypothetical protein
MAGPSASQTLAQAITPLLNAAAANPAALCAANAVVTSFQNAWNAYAATANAPTIPVTNIYDTQTASTLTSYLLGSGSGLTAPAPCAAPAASTTISAAATQAAIAAAQNALSGAATALASAGANLCSQGALATAFQNAWNNAVAMGGGLVPSTAVAIPVSGLYDGPTSSALSSFLRTAQSSLTAPSPCPAASTTTTTSPGSTTTAPSTTIAPTTTAPSSTTAAPAGSSTSSSSTTSPTSTSSTTNPAASTTTAATSNLTNANLVATASTLITALTNQQQNASQNTDTSQDQSQDQTTSSACVTYSGAEVGAFQSAWTALFPSSALSSGTYDQATYNALIQIVNAQTSSTTSNQGQYNNQNQNNQLTTPPTPCIQPNYTVPIAIGVGVVVVGGLAWWAIAAQSASVAALEARERRPRRRRKRRR